jgi:predicted GNAT superfamily acetyltransferase
MRAVSGYVLRVIIRDLVIADVPAILDINQTNTPALGDETEDSMRQILEWSSIALGCDVDGDIIGFCLVLQPGTPYTSSNYLWFSERYADFAYLDRVGLRADHQGRGYGAALYAEVEKLTEAEWFTLEVTLKPLNEGSLRFHHRLGFTEVGQQVSSSGKLVSLMAKQLTTSP